MLEQGPTEQRILEQVRRENLPIPKRIQHAPRLRMGLELYLWAFQTLSNSRPSGFGPGRLSWSIIQDYCDRLGLDREQTADMHFLLVKMDDTWMEWYERKHRSGSSSPRPSNA